MDTPIVTINGIQYDASNANQQTAALIQDLATIQAELSRIKTSYDITNIARTALLEGIKKLIEAGDSGLVEIQQENQEAPEASNN